MLLSHPARMIPIMRRVLYALPFLFFASDALAWGLYTHVFYAQLLVWAVPLLDPQFRRAVARFPRLVLAGAVLPDLSLVGGKDFAATHQWPTARRLLDEADTDEERALALGYASHLFTDIIAHNHFVPSHETLWLETRLATHIAAEWAMDAHIAPSLFAHPAQLLRESRETASMFVANHVVSGNVADMAPLLDRLAGLESLLRGSRLHQGIYALARRLDAPLERRFSNYVSQTAARLGQINRLVAGEEPVWQAEPPCRFASREHVRSFSSRQLTLRMPIPEELF